MRKYKSFLSLLIYSTLVFTSIEILQAQSILTLEEAIRIGLDKNFDIKLQRISADIAATNNTPGNAGMMPNVALTAGSQYAQTSLRQKFSNGNEIDANAVGQTQLNASIALNWTIFDGFRMFAERERLTILQTNGELLLRRRILQTVYDIAAQYVDIVRQNQQLRAQNEVIVSGEERVKIAEARFNSGLGAKNDVLLAQIDLNVRKEDALRRSNLIRTAKRALNLLLVRPPDVEFDVIDSVASANFSNELFQKVQTNPETVNLDVILAKNQIAINQLLEKNAQSLGLPRAQMTAGYSLANQRNEAGFSLLNTTFGPYAGLTLSVPLYQGGNVSVQRETALLNTEISKITAEQTTLAVLARLDALKFDWQTNEKLLAIELRNVETAKEFLDMALARLRLGQTTSLEVREAQSGYEQAKTRLADIRYSLKLSELALKFLAGAL